MIYTKDIPLDNPKQAKRLGYRLPRSILLPPYLSSNPVFVDFADAIDDVFDKLVDEKTDILKNVRNMWVGNPDLENKIINHEILSVTDWSLPEQRLSVSQLKLLGMQLGVPTVMFDSLSFTQLARFIGQYWMQKGTGTFLDFINFCTGTKFVIKNCWTTDYNTFYPEGDDRIGTPIWEGGDWYPTTHVQFQAINSGTVDSTLLSQLFFEVANYNLVLHSINSYWVLDFTHFGNYSGFLLNTTAILHTEYRLDTEQ